MSEWKEEGYVCVGGQRDVAELPSGALIISLLLENQKFRD